MQRPLGTYGGRTDPRKPSPGGFLEVFFIGEDKMTVNEIADLASVSPLTVRRQIKELFPGKLENGKKTTLNQAEATAIMAELRKPGFIEPIQNEQVPIQNEQVSRLDRMERMMEQLIGAIGATVAKQNAIAPPPAPSFYTVVAYANLVGSRVDKAAAQAIGIKAKRLCLERGEAVHLIPNESFGSVNAYPVAILAEVFA
jgi:hypothetical protein